MGFLQPVPGRCPKGFEGRAPNPSDIAIFAGLSAVMDGQPGV
ncbi:hypothetical protein ASZ90_009719 [hydrocarbon metagenome]|uniref:Uncharacterized protein n=1 Tax=hydrocarbon metagenome TaxID=938273 RepID=A0A0W8FI54_9ZZZZ